MTKEQKFFLLIVLIIAGASITYYVQTEKGQASSEMQTTTQTTTSAPKESINPNANVPVTTTNTGTQQAGAVSAKSYTSSITYKTPERGSETIHVTMSIKDGVISDLSFTYDTPTKEESGYFLNSFKTALGGALVGKKLGDVSLSRVGGASLTTKAFMNAVADVSAQVNG